MSAEVTLVTPTFAKDLERFTLQRESIERCGIDLPHVALIDHEDLPQFESMPFRRNLRLISSKDVLPGRLEARRAANRLRRRDPGYWLGYPNIHGWTVQQLLKLASAKVVETEGIVCLDSDTFFVDCVSASDFYAEDGRMHLYESSDDVDAEMGFWTCQSMRFLGVRLLGLPITRYTHSPVPWSRSVLREMLAFVEARHKKHWWDAILGDEQIMEYSLYGVYARHIDACKRHKPVKNTLCTYYWWPDQTRTIHEDIAERVRADRSKAVLVNSNIGRSVDDYRSVVRSMWRSPGC